jgi:DNA-binding transcriptional LysR family regulator
MDRLTSMAVFSRVATTRSFSGAARELGISQATASKHVQTLEEWLGARLLERTTRRVDLTEFGQGFLAQCTRILEEVADARLANQPDGALHGEIRLSAPVAYGIARLGPALAVFMRTHPAVSLNVTLSDRAVNVTEEGFDLALRIAEPSQPDMLARFVQAIPYVVCASPDYVARHGAPTSPQDLTRHSCAIDANPPHATWRFAGPRGDINVAVAGRLHSNSAPLLRDAALAGEVVLCAPAFLVERDIGSGTLVALLPDYVPRAGALHAIIPRNRQLSPKVRALLALLTEASTP